MNLEKILNNAQNCKKNAHISAPVSYDVKAKLDELSKVNKVTLSMLIESILNEFLEVTSLDEKKD